MHLIVHKTFPWDKKNQNWVLNFRGGVAQCDNLSKISENQKGNIQEAFRFDVTQCGLYRSNCKQQ